MTLPQLRRREASVDGRVMRLRPMETALVSTLLASSPYRPLDYDALIEAMWPNPDTQALTAHNVLHVMVVRLRRRGIEIQTWWGRGFVIPAECRGAPDIDQPCYERLAA
jgi:DNA-binding response OmpR family regulator